VGWSRVAIASRFWSAAGGVPRRRGLAAGPLRKRTPARDTGHFRTYSAGVSVEVQADELADLRRRARFWEAQHRRAKKRADDWKAEADRLRSENRRLAKALDEAVAELDAVSAELANLKRQHFGRSTEQRKEPVEPRPATTQKSDSPEEKRNRGQQPDSKGHGRTPRPDLETREVLRLIPEKQLACPRCGRPYRIGARTEDSSEYVWETVVFHRLIKRQVGFRSCDCPEAPVTVTAPLCPKLIPKGQLSVETWVNILLDKYLLQRPLSRSLSFLALKGFPLASGTVVGGLGRITPVLDPLYAAILERNRSATHWFMDETRWMVFEEIEGKSGYRWWLWVSVSHDTCAFILDSTRSATVPAGHLKGDGETFPTGVLNCDRYSAYKWLATASGNRILLAYCWAHARRDFDKVEKGHPRLAAWAAEWLGLIGELYAANDRRLGHWIPPAASGPAPQSEAFRRADDLLRARIDAMAERRDAELTELAESCGSGALPEAKRKPLESLVRHWDGLTLFVDRPEIPMDNNTAERALRDNAVGRKTYYGSGSVWAGSLTAKSMTVFKTLLMNGINPERWLFAYLTACAANGGKAP